MNVMKRFGLVALVFVGMILLARAPAQAEKQADWLPIQLTNVGNEPQATGEVTFRDLKFEGDQIWSQKVTITCQNMTPKATYSTPFGTFIADRRGQGKISGTIYYYPPWGGPPFFDVYRVDPEDGSLILVLTNRDDLIGASEK